MRLQDALLGNTSLTPSSFSFSESNSASTTMVSTTAYSSVNNIPEIWSCLICVEEAVEAVSIKCSRCLLFIHFNCNEGGVTKYYKKN